MKRFQRQLSLHEPVCYQIKVPGQLDQRWTEWESRMTVSVLQEEDGLVVTTLTGAIDQAALVGVVRRLYSLGLPIISVIHIESSEMVASGT